MNTLSGERLVMNIRLGQTLCQIDYRRLLDPRSNIEEVERHLCPTFQFMDLFPRLAHAYEREELRNFYKLQYNSGD